MSCTWRPTSFDGFEIEKILYHDPDTKSLGVLGSFKGVEGRAIVKLQRQHFDIDNIPEALNSNTNLQMSFENDVYSKYTAVLPTPHTLVNVDLTHPATDLHIKKAQEQPYHMVHETPKMYQNLVLPFIQSLPPSRLQWVYNMLDKKKEVEPLIFEDPDPQNGFMMHPDMKWDKTTTQQLYCLVLCNRRDILNLRSLTAEHLPLLYNIKKQAAQVIQDRFGVPPDQLRMYVHYLPSYYHFHVHVTHVKLSNMGSAVGKAYLLEDIIDNIETYGSDFYQRKTLTVTVGENEDLWGIYSKAVNENAEK
ncbi:hypothetical protein CEUSTIGMA_g6590.t1 [Chlamydomonas eustigma]|uniref:m7GpppX diphosphatase n=1 Tax=Chlamydomonas eustigma TaxID=1157962 RepID=A0A250X8Q0_9CHLO|nr:hypothetical protein CEUSTIGMA_g6590.t1 [Chlamydomonas eustigma]|eukprot:GAX79150.1 hypothetical protein CEUSTIGMA_g6590.t1 [Chlamydomonas eustigma]